jgi:hypothetical protein
MYPLKTIYRGTWGDVFPTCGDFAWGELLTLPSSAAIPQENQRRPGAGSIIEMGEDGEWSARAGTHRDGHLTISAEVLPSLQTQTSCKVLIGIFVCVRRYTVVKTSVNEAFSDVCGSDAWWGTVRAATV